MQVALRAELLDKNGEVVWQKDFMAPFAEQITDQINEPGQTLRFSIPGTANKSIITKLNVYPNPSKGLLNLQVKSDNKYAGAHLSIESDPVQVAGLQVKTATLQILSRSLSITFQTLKIM